MELIYPNHLYLPKNTNRLMISSENYNKWIVLIHTLFWLFLTTLMLFVLNSIIGKIEVVVSATLINLTGFMILTYGNLFYLLPNYFDKKQYKKYGIGILLLLLVTSAVRFFVGWTLVVQMQWEIESRFTPSYFATMVFDGIFIFLMAIPLRLLDNWFKKHELEKELKTYQLEAELRFLKAQVNPHFLFNALNNIYSLSFIGSPKTPEMILKLSDMMSYMLYDCKSEKVPLKSEIEYLNNYITLQQLKKDGEFNIEFEIKGAVNGILITPMLFIPFFENVFKHGNLEDTKNGWLKSSLSLENRTLHFQITNTYNPKNKTTKKSGVGLENIKERLNLLFPTQHTLAIKNTHHIFSINLTLNI